MNIDQAAVNISNVLQNSRINTPNGPLTSLEHQQLAADLSLLISRAQLAGTLEDKLAGNVELSNKLETEVANFKIEIVNLKDEIVVLRKPETPEVPVDPPRTGNESKEVG